MNMEEFDLMMKLMELIKIKNEIASERRKAGLAVRSPGPSRPKSIYTCQPGRLVQCNFKEKHKANAYPRTCQRIVATDSHFYVVGGYNALNHVPPYNMFRNFQEVWSFNLATKRWKQELDSDNVFFPESFFISAIVPYNSMLLVSILEGEGRNESNTKFLFYLQLFGGLMLTPEVNKITNECYVFHTSDSVPKLPDDAPQRVPGRVEHFKMTGDMPQADYGQGTVIHNNYLYSIGQPMTIDYTSEVHRLHLKTMVWEKVFACDLQIQRFQHDLYRNEVIYDGKHIFVLGNCTSFAYCNLKRVPAFNLATHTWDFFDTLPDGCRGYPQRRYKFSSAQHTSPNGDIEAYITGGTQQGVFENELSDIWKLNMRTMKWTQIQSNLPARVHCHSAATAKNGCMYIYGGTTISEHNRVQVNTTAHKMWLKIPKLKDMCWDAITYYNENIDLHDRQALHQEGIPTCYTDRLPPQKNACDRGS